MSTISVISKIVLVENFLCVFRNYSLLKSKHRTFVKLFIFVVILSLFILSLVLLYQEFQIVITIFTQDLMNAYSLFMYSSFSITNSLFAIFLSIINAKCFKIYYDCINAIYEQCKGDVIFLVAITKLNKRVLITAAVVTTVFLRTIVDYVFQYFKHVSDFDTIFCTVYTIFDATLQLRYIVESFTFFILMEVVVACLQYLISSVVVATEKIERKIHQPDNEEFLDLEDDLAKWWVVSQRLSECCDQLTSCFGLQIALVIYTATMYYILLLYKSVYIFTQPYQEGELTTNGYSLAGLLAEYVIVTLLILSSGQHLRNGADKLEKALAMLCNDLVYFEGSAAKESGGSARALARRLRAAPLRVRLLSRPAQASLLTAVLAATANYTLILLQFNHVV